MDLKALCVPRSPGFTKTLRIMRITAIIMLAALMQVSAAGDAQMVSINVKNAPLTKVFSLIENQTDYVFFFDAVLLKEAKPVTISMKDGTVESILKELLKDQPLDYSIENKTITIIKKQKPQNPNSVNILFPPVEVHGRVTDSLGNPLQGASVTVKGIRKGTTTDKNGNFELKGVDGNATITVSFTGYEPQQIKLNGKNEFSISLKQSITSMHDVVINKGYYNTTQRLNTGDVSIVTSKEIGEQPVTDPMLALEGRVPGLYISQNSGDPGSYSAIQIMGQNSLFNGNAPFYLIDGVPYSATSLTSPDIGQGVLGSPNSNGINLNTNYGGVGGMSPFNLLNPADIESITVLKDADATAIYGSRGANGVILITTKKGKAGNTRVDVNISQGDGNVTRMMKLLNTQQYLAMRHGAFNNDGTAPDPNVDFDVNGVWDTTRYTNWQKVLIGNTAHYSNVNLNISGGNVNTQFMIGGTFNRQTTVYPGDYADKKAGGFFSLTHQSANKKFNALFSSTFVNDNSNLPVSGLSFASLTLAPDAPAIYDKDGSLNWELYQGSSTWTNPLSYTVVNALAKTNNLVSNLNLSYQLLPGLRLKTSFGYNLQFMDQSTLQPGTLFPPPYNTNPSNRRNLSAVNQANTWNIEPQISYDGQMGKGKLNVLVGTTLQEDDRNSNSYFARGFASDALINYPAAASTFFLFGSENSLYHYNAVYGRIGYGWDDKYLLNLTARRDGSSRFGPGKQFGNFGAIGAGWIFTKEKSIADNLPWLSFGKLRGSYGITGNDQIGDYQYLSSYSVQSSFQYLGSTTFQPNGLTNPYFAWERVKKLEGGLDLGFFKDRIFLSAIYYQNRDDNQLVGYTLPLITGFSYVVANLPASVQNSGWEFTLNTQNIVSASFKWSSSINLTLPQNKLLAFPNIENTSYNTTYTVGKSIFIHYVYHYTGVDPQTGVYTFASKDGSGIPSYPQDLTVSKPTTRSAFGGFNNNFSYKGFQLDILIQFVKQLGYSYLTSSFLPGTFNNNLPNFVLNAWRQPGDNTNVQKFTESYSSPAARAFGNLESSDAAISDASFIRLKNLAFSYTLPFSWIKKASIQNLKVYLQAQNLFTITSYKGLDPETESSYALPPIRMITFGLQASL
jgi:TonB-linked SusC/RagA family outer membrane protein